ncbi:preprotein translocase subunit YajC [Sphingobacterium sp. ML3W]|jgi:preprotein translocase, YajC subunit|uniref:Sec translocon accessory complex subunit YajC n=2 Tax=Sphingobacterium TaxID=28453 RepID=A0A420BIS4_SPHD1|nr:MULTISPECIES: preprotein translocase subunit YajC [Sphingobacterium]MCS4223943.1 preprotein translocase subunit YajC [Sphingobacterium sp. BIGb0165]MDF2475842.1 preprotein translocase subunit YajC [Sphingobacterium sp.]RKE56671.1 protein translocase subunit yajC [Sphingobacterium detergens]WFA81700.1 preprotein translocase subunit YajC [Sphingobacterium sp. ML3W]
MNTVLLQAAGGSSMMSFLPMVLIIVVFYFFMIRPQMKKQKDHKKYIEELGVNSKVVTTAGIHGRIVEVSDTTFLVDVGSGVRIRFDKSAIALDASKAANATEKSAS